MLDEGSLLPYTEASPHVRAGELAAVEREVCALVQ